MMTNDVAVFTPYPFHVGQKIRIEAGRRRGDWLVEAIDEKNVTLKCPISKKEFKWAKFCYHVEERKDAVWPQK